jgi:carboxyl-terminal processing protease
VQRVGLVPQIRYPFVVTGDAAEDRESKLAHSAPPWRGPDLRDPTVPIDDAAWPSHGGIVGPCTEQDVCKALRLLGGPNRRPVAKH